MLKVVPSEVELKAGESQAFEALEDGNPASGIKWVVFPSGVGELDQSGVYSAPLPLFAARRVTIVALKADDNGVETARGSARIDLDPSRSWIPVLGATWVVLFAALLVALLWQWSELCPQCQPPGVFVSPPVVTLTKGQGQHFIANVSATWTNSVNNAGLYLAPEAIDAEQTVTVTATSRSSPEHSGVAVVRLNPSAGMTVVPSRASISPGDKLQLATMVHNATGVTPEWLAPAIGKIENGVFIAPESRQRLRGADRSAVVQTQLAVGDRTGRYGPCRYPAGRQARRDRDQQTAKWRSLASGGDYRPAVTTSAQYFECERAGKAHVKHVVQQLIQECGIACQAGRIPA